MRISDWSSDVLFRSLRLAVVAGEPAPVRCHKIVSFRFGYRCKVVFPIIGKNPRRAFLVKPQELFAPGGEDAAHYHFADALRMFLAVSQSQRRTPRTAKDHQLFGFQDVGAQSLDVAHRSEEHTSELQSLMRISY